MVWKSKYNNPLLLCADFLNCHCTQCKPSASPSYPGIFSLIQPLGVLWSLTRMASARTGGSDWRFCAARASTILRLNSRLDLGATTISLQQGSC